MHVFEKKRKWIIDRILEYLVETDVDTLVVVGVETLDEVDTDEDVEYELEVDTLQRKLKRNCGHKLPRMSTPM